ncbi:hypothetical protein QFC21_006088 [Naganishia friedmannii]|uniref:Uncharacterized protein n=1 Tax=Naganishia friedmannii TaxID=89922 RepID=A0ACC2V6R7_9TREE|nr:hypothetical protein QFC21_006088 [Naganishia friedmannii]
MPQEPTKKIPASRHMVWYREIVPGIFFTLTLLQTHLSHSRSLSDSSARITRLEEQLADLREKHSRQAVNWSEGLGRVVRRVRDLGREVHEFDDLKVLATTTTPQAQAQAKEQVQPVQEAQQGPSLPARIMAAFGGGGGGASPNANTNANTNTIASASSAAKQVADEATSLANETAARTARIASSLASTTFQKMDHLRETSSSALTNASQTIDSVLSDVHQEASNRLHTLPPTPATDLSAAIRDAPGGDAFAAKLLATFGNPRKDAQKTEAEVDHLSTLARETSVQDLTQKANASAQLVRDKMHDSFERVAERMDPVAQRVGEKMDQWRETSEHVLERVEERVEGVVHELREEAGERLRTLPATPETDLKAAVSAAPGGETFAARLLATFGNPRADAQKTTEEVRRLETLARETSVQDLKDKTRVVAGAVSEELHDGFESVAQRIDPLAQRVGGKMDQWRETSGEVLERVEEKVEGVVHDLRQEAEDRVRTLPATPETDLKAAVKQAPVPGSFAARLMATFGNPSADSTKTTQELSQVGDQLAHLAQEQETRAANLAQDVVSGMQGMEHTVQAGVQELRAQGVKPLIQATATKMDSLRTTSANALANAEEQLQQHLPTSLPRPVKTADGDYPAETAEQGVLASRLIATFGRPSEDRDKSAREVARMKAEAGKVVERGEEVARPALERAEQVAQDVKGRVVAEVDEGKRRWWN